MPELHIMRAEIDYVAATRWMAHRKIRDWDRAMHCLTKESFGPELAPRPYWYETPSGSPVGQMLGYTPLDQGNLMEAAAERQNQSHREILDPVTIQTKPMSISCEPGNRFGFSVRTAPIIRIKNEDGSHHDMDAALAWAGEREETKAEIYCRWLSYLMHRQGGAEAIRETLTLEEPLAVRRMRRSQRSKTTLVTDMTIQGTLEVQDEALFKKLVSDGIGKQRSFGNGMLRLRAAPPAHQAEIADMAEAGQALPG